MTAADEQGESPRTQALLTIAIAVTTLAVAGVGFLQVRANSRSGDAGQAAERYTALTMSTLLQSQENAKVGYEEFLRVQEQRTQAGNAFQQAVFSSPGDRALLRLVQERFERLAAQSQRLTPLTPNSIDGPRRDPEFPRHYFARSTGGALRYQALQDAANHQNSAWESRGAKYTAILTLLAVALYLFGFALAVPRRVVPIFGAVGALLLAIGLGWTGAVAASTPKRISATAAAEYSRGEVALETSTIGFDTAGFQQSIAHFTRAIETWPSFARAYLGRANARLSTAPQVQASLIPPEDLEAVIGDLRKARGLGLDSAAVLEQLAGAEFSLGLHGKPSLYGAAAKDAAQAIDRAPSDPVARYSLAISLLAQGKTAAAAAAYEDAIGRTLYLNGDPAKPRNAPQFEELWVSGALSDLEALRAAKPELGDAIDREKEFVVGSAALGRPTQPGGTASFPTVQAQVLPSILTWATAGGSGFDPNRDVMSVQWYTRSPGERAWVGMPEPSGRVDPRVEPSIPRFSNRNLTSSSIPPRCARGGDYRVELYVGSHLAGSAETTVTYAPLKAFIDRALNLEVCHPPSWKLSKYTLPGFRQGLVSEDGKSGVYLIRYDLALLPEQLRGRPAEQVSDALLLSTMATSPFLVPGRRIAQSPPQHRPSLALPGSTQRSFGYANGLLAFGQSSVDQHDKAALVTIVFGPQPAFAQPGGRLLPVVASLGEYRYGG